MIFFEATLSPLSLQFCKNHIASLNSVEKANDVLQNACGIVQFFDTQTDLFAFKKELQTIDGNIENIDRRAYGDFQTNDILAEKVNKLLIEKGTNPQFVVEPTCGKGAFIIAALKHFRDIKKIVGIEIYRPYVWQTKFRILHLHLNNEATCKPIIQIFHADIFTFSLEKLANESLHLNTLVIGNPPWITNSELGTLNSKNLPRKANFKKHTGIDAITGKGNFDIGEYIAVLMLKNFHKHSGIFAFLIKSSVAKNIVFDQRKSKFRISKLEKLNIDAKKEFNVSVSACLFIAQLKTSPLFTCKEANFYVPNISNEFGWYCNKFVYDIQTYQKYGNIDGKCSFVWRQGVKHDCSKIMELEKANGHYRNGFKQKIKLEKDLLYGLLKSSDLKTSDIKSHRKTTIITQKKIGQNTNYIAKQFPQTYAYLQANRAFFDKRKSSIYKGKPAFSIFGIGDYSFATYKIAISGMYKRTTFSLVYPKNNKPLMLDDTCYFIGFENLNDAKIVQTLLNSPLVQHFLKAIIFPEAKRSITKDILMRIDLGKVFEYYNNNASNAFFENINMTHWNIFGKKLFQRSKASNQMSLL